jgi:adenosylhomocysteine nucleosidase
MEGAALAQTSSRLGVDHIVIRSLSDLAGDSAGQHFDRFLAEVSANSARLVLAILRRLEEDDRDLSVGA